MEKKSIMKRHVVGNKVSKVVIIVAVIVASSIVVLLLLPLLLVYCLLSSTYNNNCMTNIKAKNIGNKIICTLNY